MNRRNVCNFRTIERNKKKSFICSSLLGKIMLYNKMKEKK